MICAELFAFSTKTIIFLHICFTFFLLRSHFVYYFYKNNIIYIYFFLYIFSKGKSPCGTYNKSAGTFMSPNYPSNYFNNEDCDYVIKTPAPHDNIIHLTFEFFSTEKDKDVLEVSSTSIYIFK